MERNNNHPDIFGNPAAASQESSWEEDNDDGDDGAMLDDYSASDEEEEQQQQQREKSPYFNNMPKPPERELVNGLEDPKATGAFYVCGDPDYREKCHFSGDRKQYFSLVPKGDRYVGDCVCDGCHGVVHRKCLSEFLGYTPDYLKTDQPIYCARCQDLNSRKNSNNNSKRPRDKGKGKGKPRRKKLKT